MRSAQDVTIPAGAWRGDGIPAGPVVMTIHSVAPSGEPGWVSVQGWRSPGDVRAVSRIATVVEVRADVLPAHLLDGLGPPSG